MNLTDILKERLLVFDGGMGTELYNRHIFTNRSYDEVCLSMPSLVEQIHNDYVKAGADVLTTNSFGANAICLKAFGFAEKAEAIAEAAARLARKCADACTTRKILVAGSVGPIPTLNSSAEARVAAYAAQVKALLKGGADFIIFETLSGREAAREACLAIQQAGDEIPFVLSHAIPAEVKPDAEYMRRRLALFRGLPRPQALGLNCCIGPARMLTALEAAAGVASLPLIVQPNAGVSKLVDGRHLYLCSPEYLFTYAVRYVNLGARGIGGCCGISPSHITELSRAVKPLSRASAAIEVKEETLQGAPGVTEAPLAGRSELGRRLAAHEWVTTIEMTAPSSWDATKMIEKAKLCKEHGVTCLNVPDGPRACPKLSALIASMLIQREAGIEAVLHICGRDRNIVALQSEMLGAAACGVKNVLLITGDPPKLGNYSFASGVFDTDSIGLVKLQKALNRGVDFGGSVIQPPTAAVVGVGADPNAIDFDREVRRMREKAEAGADYITTQPVFDPDSLFRFMDAIADLNLPVIAGIWPLTSLRNATFMRNEVPGVTVPDEVMRRMSEPETGEAQMAVGLQIAKEAVERIRSRVAGIQVSAPFGKVQLAFEVMGK